MAKGRVPYSSSNYDIQVSNPAAVNLESDSPKKDSFSWGGSGNTNLTTTKIYQSDALDDATGATLRQIGPAITPPNSGPWSLGADLISPWTDIYTDPHWVAGKNVRTMRTVKSTGGIIPAIVSDESIGIIDNS